MFGKIEEILAYNTMFGIEVGMSTGMHMCAWVHVYNEHTYHCKFSHHYPVYIQHGKNIQNYLGC